ncbi:MAG TPA: bifunctional demethylmenaquinone methyltransferase/2-methoxy-6-polyprenyl-1,4-benzoquinol methylase UbiE [Candidatus Angelobacter sp.]|nr:bifunctional demethylmenaquinone methyltransferase/2-methoxy-6-polyprenyl-1,4-benzoquinol methylase UbiE [Candidatus Angelobacter sp.]
MTSHFYKPGEQRAAKVGELFATIARRYDLINDIQSFGLHRSWKRRLLRLARPRPGQRALDLCCGTGDIALALARQGMDVVGLDFSPPMLEIAKQKADRFRSGAKSVQNLNFKVEFLCGDAEQIPFPANTFDLLTVGYGLRNLADLDQGLRDMLRVAKPGGQILALEFGKPENPLWRTFYFTYLKCFLPIFGKVFCGNSAAYAYVLESLKNYPAQQAVAAKMRDLGWQNIRVLNILGGTMTIHHAEKP